MPEENVLSYHLLRPVRDGTGNKTGKSHSVPTGRDVGLRVSSSTGILSRRGQGCPVFLSRTGVGRLVFLSRRDRMLVEKWIATHFTRAVRYAM
jgi:hypothetical protein